MKSLAVFCGSSLGSNKLYSKIAFELGQYLAKKNIQLIYGGAQVGLMGAVADGALYHGGKVVGVLPDFLKSKEIAHANLTELVVVGSMHERKMKMDQLADGVIALPGGYGTLEELFEMITWAQLGLHKKPVGILNINGFFDPLMMQVEKMVQDGFLKKLNQDMLLVDDSIEGLLQKMDAYVAPEIGKWIKEDEV